MAPYKWRKSWRAFTSDAALEWLSRVSSSFFFPPRPVRGRGWIEIGGALKVLCNLRPIGLRRRARTSLKEVRRENNNLTKRLRGFLT